MTVDTATPAVTIVAIVVGQVCALLSLWLRLRWRAQQEREQRQYLARTIEAVPGGSRMKVDEQRSDGHRLRIEIICGSTGTQEGRG